MEEHKIKSIRDLEKLIQKKSKEMQKLAAELEFEKAAEVRDTIAILRETLLSLMGQSEGPE